jgi:uncharacterized membrane protein (TIGR02234 family)
VTSARREYAACLALGAVGAGLVVLCARQGWARVVTPPPAPMPAASVQVTGQNLVPLAGALGLAALAALAAVIATRGLPRRLVGGLIALFGVAIAVVVSTGVSAAAVLAAAQAASGGSQEGSATAGGPSGVSPGAVPGGAAPGVSAAGHVTLIAAPWRPLTLAGALVIVAAGVLVAWRGVRWPVMSSKYERPPGRARRPAGDTATMWEALSRGGDPTAAPADDPVPHRRE